MLLRLSLVCGSLLVTLALLELLFHLVFPQPTYAVRFAPWGFEHIPNIAFKHTPESRETVTYLRYNSEGFRGAVEYAIPAAPDTLRVAILGDSYAEGAEVGAQEVHAAVLERLLNDFLPRHPGRYRRAEVVNAGVYAYDTCQELRHFEARVMPYRPAVVFLLYTGELEENRRFCRLADGRLQYTDMAYTGAQYRMRYALGHLRAKSHLGAFVLRAARPVVGGMLGVPAQLEGPLRHRPAGDGVALGAALGAAHGAAHGPDTVEVKAGEPTRDGEDRHLLYAIVDRLAASVMSAGGELHLVFSHPPRDRNGLDDHAARRRIPAFDAHSYLERHRVRRTHLAVDGHWNEHGHALVAQGLFEVVREHHRGP